MRRTACRVAGAALLALVALAGPWSAFAAAAGSPTYLYFKPDQGHRAPIKGGEPGEAGRTWGYWGKLIGISTNPALSGSYRATCTWLANLGWGNRPKQRDSRMLCTVLLSFQAIPAAPYTPNGGSLVAQGLVKRPPKKENLLAHPSTRKLAITGGTGPYSLARGYADFGKAPMEIKITVLP
jgi:hypothetical protein